MKVGSGTLIAYSLALLFGLGALGILAYYELVAQHLLPVSDETYLRLALAFALGLAAILVVQRILGQFLQTHVGPRRGGLLFTAYRFLAYSLLIVLILVLAGVNSLAILAGGTFAGLVIGLAGQTALSNIIAGIVLLFVRPINPGERVTLVSWQYGLLMPSYPPKFFSQDFLVPGYTGTVRELGLVYSSVALDEGPTMRVPNSVLIQAAILSHDLADRWVRARYEVPAAVDPNTLLARLAKELPRNTWVTDPDHVRVFVLQATPSSYIISVDAKCRGAYEDPPRSALLLEIMGVVRELLPKPSGGRSSA
jgi:small conductance mechanosensitive channel